MVMKFNSWQGKVNQLTAAVSLGLVALGTSSAVLAQNAQVVAAAPQAQAPLTAQPKVVAAKTSTLVMKDAGPSCAGGLPEPMVIQMNVGKSTLVNMPEQIVRRTLGDPEIVAGHMVAPRVLYLAGGRIGSTNAILEGASGRCVLMDIRVELDTSSLQSKLAELIPNEKGIKVSSAADSIVLSGVVADATTVDRAVTIANAFARASYTQNGERTNAALGSAPAVSPRIVNLLAVSSPQQVMLEVKVAEVSKTLLNKLGVGIGVKGRTSGSWTFDLMTPHLSGSNIAATAAHSLTDLITLEAQKDDGLARILAEPTVMAISGQEGSFLAGGKILIPVAQSSSTVGGGAAIGLQEREYGVGLRFTPVVLADGRINLKVAPEVSELSQQGAKVSTTNDTGAVSNTSVFPLITTRRASTTVQLMDGQSFVIGGLVKSSTTASISAFPGLGELPILGALFRSNNFQQEKTEMVFVVTPRLVKPLAPDYQLPTDRVTAPAFSDMVVQGKLEGQAQADTASTKPAPQPQADGMQLK